MQIRAKYGKSSAHIAYPYFVQNEIVVITKSVHRKRMKQNFAVFNFNLLQDNMKQTKSFNS